MKARPFFHALGLVLLLIPAGCRPETPRITLHQAVLKGDAQTVRQHIEAGTDLNTTDGNGWTALQLASMRGDLPIVRALSAAGADATRTGRNGQTALDLARAYGRTPVVQFLQSSPEKRGRPLVDGGLGVSGVLDAQ